MSVSALVVADCTTFPLVLGEKYIFNSLTRDSYRSSSEFVDPSCSFLK